MTTSATTVIAWKIISVFICCNVVAEELGPYFGGQEDEDFDPGPHHIQHTLQETHQFETRGNHYVFDDDDSQHHIQQVHNLHDFDTQQVVQEPHPSDFQQVHNLHDFDSQQVVQEPHPSDFQQIHNLHDFDSQQVVQEPHPSDFQQVHNLHDFDTQHAVKKPHDIDFQQIHDPHDFDTHVARGDQVEDLFLGSAEVEHVPDSLAFPNDEQWMQEPQYLHFGHKLDRKQYGYHHHGQRAGCNTRPQIPANSILRCPSFSNCRASCLKGYELPNGDRDLTIICIDKQWLYSEEYQQAVPSCKPLCLPPCQHNGICVAPDQCDCPKNFGGPQCQYENKPCMNSPALPANSMRTCTSRSCTYTCANGYAFPDGSGITNTICKDGQWTLSRPDWTSLPDCEPICHPPCTNGGNCLAFNVCQCPQHFTGPQCQYEMSACTGKKLQFNGQYNCTGDGEKLVCNIHCPPGILLNSPAAQVYTCLYSTGKFVPDDIPQCVYGDNMIVKYNSSASSFYTPGQVIQGNTWIGGHGPVQVEGEINKLFQPDMKPTPGECSTWEGCHYKNFDGRIYSFDGQCSYTLVKDSVGNSFTIIMENAPCASPPCYRNIKIYYKNKEYVLTTKDNVQVLKIDGKVMGIPTQQVGLSVELKASYILTTLQALDVTIRWDGKDYVAVFVKENMWNRTAGLCGNMNNFPSDDFYTSQGFPAQNLQTFIDSWRWADIENDECIMEPKVEAPCVSESETGHCRVILEDPHFDKCRQVVNAKTFYEACVWDVCKCGLNCSCSTVEAFVEECKKHLSDPCPLWRAISVCPRKCDGGKVYSSCGPELQPTCGSYEKTDVHPGTVCFEGCFCPNGTVLHDGKCIVQDLCPCQRKGKVFESGQKVPKGCNTCTCEAGKWVCTQVNCGARCSSVGDPHYVTFDGKRYDFMGQCSYYLVKSDNYTVEAENIACSGSISKTMSYFETTNESPSCTRAITVRHGADTVKLKQNRQVLLNGEEVTSFPVQANQLSIRAISSIFLIVTITPLEVEVWWDGVTSVYVDVPGDLQGRTQGLCGTFNDNQKDDFVTPEGDVEQSTVAFANKWKTEEQCAEVSEPLVSHPCDGNIKTKALAEKYCKQIKAKVFEGCHWFVDPEPFYRNCLYDVCSCTKKPSSCFCPILSDYGNECAREGVPVFWRDSVRECGIHCPGGQSYQACGDSCSRSCQDIAFAKTSCRRKCVEGCNCPEGLTLNDYGECIPVSECPCQLHNKQYLPGHQLVMDHAKGPQFCNCSNALWSCRGASQEEIDHDSEVNQIKQKCRLLKHEEFTPCEPAQPVTCKNMHKPREESSRTCMPGCVCIKGYVWDSIGKECVEAAKCPCHHGGVSYSDGDKIQQDCNTCTCHSGAWNCTERVCPAVCRSWGDSHFKTFDGHIYDFQGACDFVLAAGSLSTHDVFDVSIQLVPCGSTGISCPKSVTLKVGPHQKREEIVLSKSGQLATSRTVGRITVRQAGLFVFAEVYDLGVVLQWDRGTRVYLRVDPRWRNKLKGLCGNFNDNEMDDFKTPSSGDMSEVSPVLFADSWRLQSYCPESVHMTDTCLHRPSRRQWAVSKCAILKSAVFQPCHSQVSFEPYLERCVIDTCGCDEGGDCECLCSAVAAYADECTLRGVPLRWRTPEMCPLQCDAPGSKYSSCISTCPHKTCENQFVHSSLSKLCLLESCVEGCEVQECKPGDVFTDSSLHKCKALGECKTVCLVEGGQIYYEGDLMEEDDCHSCYCSRHKKTCTGQPCSTTMSTLAPFTQPQDQDIPCQSGWSSWVNMDHPIKNKKLDDVEPLPSRTLLADVVAQHALGSHAVCGPAEVVDVRCRDVQTGENHKATGQDVECTSDKGLRCVPSYNETCHDFELSVHCSCGAAETTTTSKTVEPTTVSACADGSAYDDCIIQCENICHYYKPVIIGQNFCGGHDLCVSGCKDTSWEPCIRDTYLRDANTCVPRKDCPCRSHSGDLMKPGSVVKVSDCETCQCLDNQLECVSWCTLPPAAVTATTTQVAYHNETITKPGVGVHEDKNVTVIYLTSTASPPPGCLHGHYATVLDDSSVKLTASSSLSKETSPQQGKLTDTAKGAWVAGVENSDQFLQVDLGRPAAVYGVVVAGDAHQSYVTSYHLLHSLDGHKFSYIITKDKVHELFRGPVDGQRPVKQMLAIPVEARYLRFLPYTWRNGMAMRVDVLGCIEPRVSSSSPPAATTAAAVLCDDPMGVGLGFLHVTVSSSQPGRGSDSVSLHSDTAWQPIMNSQAEYVQVDLLEMRNITGLETKGEAHNNEIKTIIPESWVESFKVMYSRDGVTWNHILNELAEDKVFLGNFDGDTLHKNHFKLPVHARYLRVKPLTWHNRISLRLEVLGCYQEYSSTPVAAVVTTPATTPTPLCNYCKGVTGSEHCPCGRDLWWDGSGCVAHSQCPCFVGLIPYPVGSTYETEDCQECACRVFGVSTCEPTVCEACPPGLHEEKNPTCGCTCKECPEGTRLCQTSNLCLEDSAWCDGVQDCPDDEVDCPVPTTETPTCEPTCPPGYEVVLQVFHISEVPEENLYETQGETKGRNHPSKSRVSWRHLAEGTKHSEKFVEEERKGGKHPAKTNKSDKYKMYEEQWTKGGKHTEKEVEEWEKKGTAHCPPYDCVPIARHIPTTCPPPACPLNYSVIHKMTTKEVMDACPRYTCKPPVEFATCNVTSRTFNTFDGMEYKYDVCDHVLARDTPRGRWEVSMFKTCDQDHPCSTTLPGLAISHLEHEFKFYPGLQQLSFDGYNYTYDQLSQISSKSSDFNLTRIGDYLVFDSVPLELQVVYDQQANTKLRVQSDAKGHVVGLCGLYNGDPQDDKTTPVGGLAQTTVEFGHSWLNPHSDGCEAKVCPLELQEVAFKLCHSAREKPFLECSHVVNIDQFISRCVESACACLMSNRTRQDCRCSALLELVTKCKTPQSHKQLFGWRLDHDCPSTCPPHLVSYDCYPYSCEPDCTNTDCADPAPACYSGCFCPDGLLKKGDRCIKPAECHDCVCNGLGSSQYLTFDGSNYTFNGNCSYVAARDIPPSGVPNFQVIIHNEVCEGGATTCTTKMDIFVKGHAINLHSKHRTKVEVTVDGAVVAEAALPMTMPWVSVTEVPGVSVIVELPSYHVETRYFPNRHAFTITMPSHYYKNNVEGLCGNCNRDPADDVADGDVDKFTDGWAVYKGDHSCRIQVEDCARIDKERNLCQHLFNSHAFKQCNAIVDLTPYIEMCATQMCHNQSVCTSLEAYQQACSDVGICLKWRTPEMCPLHCPSGLEYRACEIGCHKTCDNYNKLLTEPTYHSCATKLVEGCFCPEGQLLINGTCAEESTCEVCDSERHHSGDTWHVDHCTVCTCENRVVTCNKTECSAVVFECPEEKVRVIKPGTEDECCPHFICRCKPREECEPAEEPDYELLPGMQVEVDSSGCCPTMKVVCKPETCPPPPTCAQHSRLVTQATTDCCPRFLCEKPTDMCFYELQYITSEKKGERRRSDEERNVTAKQVGESWMDGPCRTCTCLEGGVKSLAYVEASCVIRDCPVIHNHADHLEYNLETHWGTDECCPELVRTACRHNQHVYKVGDTWKPDPTDRCKVMECSEVAGIVVQRLVTEVCSLFCDHGWEYIPSNDSCCGRCIEMGCVVEGTIYSENDVWLSEDTCTTYTCNKYNDKFQVTASHATCQSVDKCPLDRIYQDGCCMKCNETILNNGNCFPQPLLAAQTVNLVREMQMFHGECSNADPIGNFTECAGVCDSHTMYQPATWSHKNVCECCQALEFASLTVPLRCEDGFIIEKYITVPSKCGCLSCGGN